MWAALKHVKDYPEVAVNLLNVIVNLKVSFNLHMLYHGSCRPFPSCPLLNMTALLVLRGNEIDHNHNSRIYAGWSLVLIGIAVAMLGVVCASLCPLKMVDLDKGPFRSLRPVV